jgi:hypothetical protein
MPLLNAAQNVRKVLLFIISIAMVVVGLLMIAFKTVGPYPYAARHAAVRWRWGDAVISRIVFVVGGFHCAVVRPSLTRTHSR